MPVKANKGGIKLPMEEIEKMFETMGFKKVKQVPDLNVEHHRAHKSTAPQSQAGTEKDIPDRLLYDALIADIREDAEWIGDNNYEVPVALYDHLLAAARAIETLLALAQNGQSSLDTGKRLSKAVQLAGECAVEADAALDEACAEMTKMMARFKVGGCDQMGTCDHAGTDVCTSCLKQTFLKRVQAKAGRDGGHG